MNGKVVSRLLAMVLAAAALTPTLGADAVAQTDWWSKFHHDLGNSGHSTSPAPNTNDLRWTFTTGGDIQSSPAVHNGRIFFGSNDNTLYCIDAETSDLLWSYTSTGDVMCSPTVSGGFVYVGFENNYLKRFDVETGAWANMFLGTAGIRSAPAVVDGLIYFGSDDSYVHCVRESDQVVMWQFDTGGVVRSSPAVVDGMVYIGSWDGSVYCLHAQTGAEIWSSPPSSNVTASPAVVDGKVYVGWTGGAVRCFDAQTGDQLWVYSTGGAVHSSPAVADGRVYVGSNSTNVHYLDAVTGDEIWVFPVGSNVESSPAVADGKVYIGTFNNRLYCLNALTGLEIWSYVTGGDVRSSPAVANGKVYVGSDDGNLYAFGSDDWPMFHHDLNNTGYSTSTTPNTVSVLWSYATGGNVRSSPTVANGRIYAGSYSTDVFCLDAVTGDELWVFPIGSWVWSSPAVANGKVYFGAYNNRVYCVDAITGVETWNYVIGDDPRSSPAIANGRLFVGADNNNVYCLDAENGDHIWTQPTGSLVRSSPAAVQDKVYIGSYDNKVYCLDASTGSEIWSYTTGGDVESSPAVVGGYVFVGSNDDKVYCLDAEFGDSVWAYPTGGDVKSSPAVANGKVYVGSNDINIYCLNATTGAWVWDHSLGASGGVYSSPAVSDAKVYIGSASDNSVYCLDADTGAEKWKYSTAGQVWTSPSVADGTVFIGSDDDNIYAFGTTPTSYTLTINPSPGGSTNPGPGAHSHDEWSIAEVEAIPDPGYLLAYWDLDGANVGSAIPISVLMDGDYTLEPVFVATYTLTITSTAGGTTNPVPGAYVVIQDSTVEVLAFPEACDTFVEWELDGMPYGSTNPVSVVMDFDHTLHAVFDPIAEIWPMFHRDQYRTGYTDSKAPNTAYLEWSDSLGGDVAFSPAYVDGRVYVGKSTYSGDNFFCYDAETGLQLWSVKLGLVAPVPIVTAPAVVEGYVYVRARDEVYCLEAATGSEEWMYTINSSAMSSVAVAYGQVYVVEQYGRVYCLNAVTGVLMWSYQMGNTAPYASPAVAYGNVYIGSDDKFYCLDAFTGAHVWDYATGKVDNAPSVADSIVYVASQGHVYGFGATSGAVLLDRGLPGAGWYSSPAVNDGKIYVGGMYGLNGGIYCLDASDGTILWKFTTGGLVYEQSSPALADGKVYMGSLDHNVYCLPQDDPDLSGTIEPDEVIWSYATGNEVHCAPAVANNMVFIGSRDNKLYAFGPLPPICQVVPTAIVFDTTIVGTYADSSFTIKNAGEAALSGTVIDTCGQYTVLSGGGAFDLAMDESLTVFVRFEPDTSGTHDCTIQLDNILCSNVSLSGFADYLPECWVSADTVNFDSLLVGDQVDTTFIITNTGGGIVSGTVAESCDHYSIVSGGGPYDLAHGDTLTVQVRFSPSTVGSFECTIELGSELCQDVFVTGVAEYPPDCWVSADTLDFGMVYVGTQADTTFIITNTGGRILSGTVSESCDHYNIESGGGDFNLAAAESLTVAVRFEPLVAGTHTCAIGVGNVLCEDVFVTGVAHDPPECWVSTDSVAFDSVTVGTYVDSTFTIKNTGVGFLTGVVTETCAHYYIVSGGGAYAIAAGDSLTVTVRFAPMAAGEHNCTVGLGNIHCSDVALTGVGEMPPFCGVIPTTLDFGTVLVDSTMDTTFTIVNTGLDSLSGTVSESCDHFSIVGDPSYALAAGESLTVTVRFVPTATGVHNCTIDAGSALCSDVSCTGIGESLPLCELSLSSLDFGTVSLGSYQDSTFIIRNIGGGILTGFVVEACDHYNIEAGEGSYNIASGDSLMVVVRFQPTTTGVHNCTIADVCSDVNCYGVGGDPPVCQVVPASIAFDSVSVGSYVDSTFTITNTGGGTLAGVVSESCDHYSIVSGGGPYSLAAGQWVTVTVRFEPDSVSVHNCSVETGSVLCNDVACTGVGKAATDHDVAVTDITPSAFTVIQGDPLPGDVTVKNQGGFVETVNIYTYYDGIIPNGGFEKDSTGTSFDDLSDWDHDLVVHKGNPPIGDEHRIVDDYHFKRIKSLYSYLKTKSVPPNPGDNWVSQYTVRETAAFTTADYVTVWLSGDGYTTSSRYAWHIELVFTDGVDTVYDRIRCDCWGNNEGCNPNHFDYYEGTAVGADGRTWKRYTVPIPGTIDKSNITVKVRHFQASWDGTQASSWFRLDHVYFSDASGDVWGLIDAATVPSLLPNQEFVQPFTWTTTGIPEGGYTLRSLVEPVTDETLTADNTFFDGVVQVIAAWPCTLTVTAGTGGTTDPSPGTYAYPCSTLVGVTALPDSCHTFDHWELDGLAAGSANPDSILLDDNHTLEAVFTPTLVCYLWPDSIDFGVVDVNAFVDTTVTIANLCGDTLSGVVSALCDHYSIVAGEGAYALTVGESLLVTVRFEPTVADTHYCTVETGNILCGDIFFTGIGDEATSVAGDDQLPTTVKLAQNYPNPFNPVTTIRYELPVDQHVRLKIFNLRGQRVATLVDGVQAAGFRAVEWNGTNDAGSRVSSGIYFCRFQAGDHVEVRKLVLLK